MEKKYISWDDFDKNSRLLAADSLKKINSLSSPNYDSIVCIERGGSVVGRIISDELELKKVYYTYYKSYTNGVQGKIKRDSTILGIDLFGEPKGNILLLDDVIETGNTIREAVKDIKERFSEIKAIYSGAIILKRKSTFRPDFYILETDKWVVFPYEKKETEKIE